MNLADEREAFDEDKGAEIVNTWIVTQLSGEDDPSVWDLFKTLREHCLPCT